jgi:hypothetical protein
MLAAERGKDMYDRLEKQLYILVDLANADRGTSRGTFNFLPSTFNFQLFTFHFLDKAQVALPVVSPQDRH